MSTTGTDFRYRQKIIFNELIVFVKFVKPFMMGTALQAVMGPLPQNWPNESSMKKRGVPHTSSMIVYGIKKAPEQKIMFVAIVKSVL